MGSPHRHLPGPSTQHMLSDLYNYPGGILLRLKWDSERPKHMCWVPKCITGERIWNRFYQLSRLGPQSGPWQGIYWIPPSLGRTSSRTWVLGTRSWGELSSVSFLSLYFLLNQYCLTRIDQPCFDLTDRDDGYVRLSITRAWFLERLEVLAAFLNWKGLGALGSELKSTKPGKLKGKDMPASPEGF